MRHPVRTFAQQGVTLVELIIFIVVVSIGVAGVLIAFNTAVASSADPMLTKQALRLAESTLQEVLQKSYQNDALDATNTSATLGASTAMEYLASSPRPANRPSTIQPQERPASACHRPIIDSTQHSSSKASVLATMP